jgi:HD-like signal output (HDOD) protein
MEWSCSPNTKKYCHACRLFFVSNLVVIRFPTPSPGSGPEKRVIPEEELRQRIIDCPDLGSLRSNIVALEELFRNQHTHAAEFTKIIARDPGLTTRLLQMVNSAYFGLTETINTIDGAVLYLGLGNVRLLMTTATKIDDLEFLAEDGTNVSWRDFWLHSLGCAFATREILHQFGHGVANDTDYLSGLLQNVGKVVMAKSFPVEFTQLAHTVYKDEAQVIAAERELLGWDHAAIGAFYLESQRIPPEVVDAVRYHHDPANAPTHQSFAAATQLADVLISKAGLKAGVEKRAVITERELMDLPSLALLWPLKGPTLKGKMRKLADRISRIPILCRVML